MLLRSESEAGSLAAIFKHFSTTTEFDLEASFAEELRLACSLPVSNLVGYSGEPLGLTDVDIDEIIQRELSRCRRLFEKQLPTRPVRWASKAPQSRKDKGESEGVEIVGDAKTVVATVRPPRAIEEEAAEAPEGDVAEVEVDS